MNVSEIGAICFGIVVGWVTYRTLRRSEDKVGLSDIASVIAAVSGGAITSLFTEENLFGCYSIGLAAGFFAYLVLGNTVFDDESWLGGGE